MISYRDNFGCSQTEMFSILDIKEVNHKFLQLF